MKRLTVLVSLLFAVLLMANPAYANASISLVQQVASGSIAQSYNNTIHLSANTTQGNRLVLALGDPNVTATAVSDTEGNAWNEDTPSSGQGSFWSAQLTKADTTADTIHVTYTAPSNVTWLALEYSGIDPNSPVDKGAWNAGASTTTSSVATVTTTQADDLVLSNISIGGSPTAPSDETAITATAPMHAATIADAPVGSYGGRWTFTAGNPWYEAQVAYKAAPTVGIPTPATAQNGKLLFHCDQGIQAQVDPLGDYGVSPSPHLHQAFGANKFANGSNIFSATTNALDPLAAGSTTTCDPANGEGSPEDHNLWWTPAPLNMDGTPATVGGAFYYNLTIAGKPISDPATLPEADNWAHGLHYIGGNSHYVGLFGPATYYCVEPNGTTYFKHTIPNTATTGCTGYQVGEFGPGECWYPNVNPAYLNNKGQGMGDGSAPPVTITNDTAATCGANGGVGIPQTEIGFNVSCNSSGCGPLSSDLNVDPNAYTDGQAGESMHFDFDFGWKATPTGRNFASLFVNGCYINPDYVATQGQVTCTNYHHYVYEAVPSTGNPDFSDPDRAINPEG